MIAAVMTYANLDASHSPPSTRQDGAHNLQHKQKDNQ